MAARGRILRIISGSSTKGDTLLNNGEMFVNLPWPPAKVGNTLALFFQHSGSVAGAIANYSCTDDQANAYTGVQGGIDGGNDQAAGGFYTINLAAAVKQIKLKNISGGNASDVQVTIVEMCNVTAIDVTNNGQSTSASITGGSLAVTQLGDLILHYGCRTSSTSTGRQFVPKNQSGIAWDLYAEDVLDGTFFAAGIYESTAAITPQCDMVTSTSWASVAMAFKSGDSGSLRDAGMNILAIHHVSVFDLADNPIKLRIPFKGNLAVIMRNGGVAGVGIIKSITDDKNNSWDVGQTRQQDASSQRCHAANLIKSGFDTELTINVLSTLGHHTYMIYDVEGADTAPFDNELQDNGTQGAAGNLAAPSTGITPKTVNGFIFGMVSWAHGTANGLTDAAMVCDSIVWDGEPVDGPTTLDENNGFGHIKNPDLAARTFTWTKTAASGSAQGWEATATAFKARPIFPGRSLIAPSQRAG